MVGQMDARPWIIVRRLKSFDHIEVHIQVYRLPEVKGIPFKVAFSKGEYDVLHELCTDVFGANFSMDTHGGEDLDHNCYAYTTDPPVAYNFMPDQTVIEAALKIAFDQRYSLLMMEYTPNERDNFRTKWLAWPFFKQLKHVMNATSGCKDEDEQFDAISAWLKQNGVTFNAPPHHWVR